MPKTTSVVAEESVDNGIYEIGIDKSSFHAMPKTSSVTGKSVDNRSFEVGFDSVSKRTEKTNLSNWFYASCLNSKITLRNQLLLSFGLLSALSLLLFVTATTLTLVLCGNTVKSLSNFDLEDRTVKKMVLLSKVLAESVTSSLDHVYGFPAILVEVTADRFVGYPDHPGYEDDSLVPFPDMISGRNKYPITADSLLPLDWEYQTSDDSFQKDIFDRTEWSQSEGNVTGSAVIRFQGVCDPLATSSLNFGYFPNCTAANNNISTGGTIFPTATFQSIHKKASDYATPVLKPLFEAAMIASRIGLFFANSGAGAIVTYPALDVNNSVTYISQGCDWLLNSHPLIPNRTIGTQQMVDRCHRVGESKRNGLYNPLERPWCSQQALDPFKAHVFGPYKDAFSSDRFVLTFGKAVYDKVTNELIACTLLDIPVQAFARDLEKVKTSDSAQLLLIRWNDNSLVVSSQWSELSVLSNDDITASEEEKTIIETLKSRFMQAYHTNSNDSPREYVKLLDDSAFVLYPLPPPPSDYDVNYTPEFAILLKKAASEVFAEIKSLNIAVNERVSSMVRTILLSVLICAIVILVCITVVTRYLTKPLQWINTISQQIFQNMGSNGGKISSEIPFHIWPEKTEISSLVSEFRLVIKDFSGQGIAKLDTHRGIEVKNHFDITSAFRSLYQKRFDYGKLFLYDNDDTMRIDRKYDDASELGKIYWGPVYKSYDVISTQSTLSYHDPQSMKDFKVFSSPLFWWILAAIALPLLLSILAISIYVAFTISNEFPKFIASVENAFITFEQHSSTVLLKAKAKFASMVIASAARDIHLLSRISSWLFFGAINNAKVFTKVVTAAEECKDDFYFPNTCPFLQNRTDCPCDCKWQSAKGVSLYLSCFNYSHEIRNLQNLWWFSSRQDAWPNGDINFTTFPNVSNSTQTTLWWDNWKSLPGANESSSEGTMYDMLKKISSQSVVQIPIHNYNVGRGAAETVSYTSLDSNGMHTGYTGCAHAYPFASQFVNDATAAALNPTLCPVGKFGYDPRCRPWYANAKLQHMERRDPLHVTPPYLYADSNAIGQTFVLPIESEDTYIGQVSVDYSISSILKSLTQNETLLSNGSFPVLISIGEFNSGTETIVAPNFDLRSTLQSGKMIAVDQFLLPFDICDDVVKKGCQNLLDFQNTMKDMRAGNAGSTSFTRTNENGDTDSVFWTFAPIQIHSFRHLNNSDFNYGATQYTSPFFAIGFALPLTKLHEAHEVVESKMEHFLLIATIVLGLFIAIIICSFSFICTRIASSIVVRFVRLLRFIKLMNNSASSEDPTDIQGGSKELTIVLDTLDHLRTILLLGNTALFSGDIKTAYITMKNALNLFTQLDNKKAIGISNNNLGNTMLSLYRTLKSNRLSTICGLSVEEIISYGEAYFKCAIDQGEVALTEINNNEGWSTNYLIFMQQLSNRYFNSAIFLFTVKSDHPEPSNAENQAYTDLSTAKDMDREVVDNGDHHGFKGDRDLYFDLLLGRIKGMHQLISMGFEDVWNVDELIDDARNELLLGLREAGHGLFNEIEPAGQMQRLDTVLIQKYLLDDDLEKSALVGIRMLIEDDYFLAEAATWAVKGVMAYIMKLSDDEISTEEKSNFLSQLTNHQRNIKETVDLLASLPGKKDDKDSYYYEVCMETF